MLRAVTVTSRSPLILFRLSTARPAALRRPFGMAGRLVRTRLPNASYDDLLKPAPLTRHGTPPLDFLQGQCPAVARSEVPPPSYSGHQSCHQNHSGLRPRRTIDKPSFRPPGSDGFTLPPPFRANAAQRDDARIVSKPPIRVVCATLHGDPVSRFSPFATSLIGNQGRPARREKL